jgi:hypothetical protein
LASCRRRPLTSNVRQRKNGRWCASKVSACRRELNSHDAAKPRETALPHTGCTGGATARPDAMSARARVEQEDAGKGGNGERVPRFGSQCRRSDKSLIGHPGRGNCSPASRSKSAVNRLAGRTRCKALRAMQSHWRAPQTRGTSTALVPALRGKQNRLHPDASVRVHEHSAA